MKLKRDYAKLSKMTDADDAYVDASPAERVGLVWEITRELWSLRNRQDAERRLQRNVATLVRQQGDLNCYAERYVKSVKSECLDHLILSSVGQLEYAIAQYCEYYHHERIHQSLGRIIEPKHTIEETAEIVCIERLGGLLKSYHRLAA